MREIIFRAKRLDNGEWCESQCVAINTTEDDEKLVLIGAGEPASFGLDEYGNLIEATTTGTALFYAANPKTVGQYTGLTDKNGKRIFEGDIVRVVSTDYLGFDESGKVEFQNGCYGVSYFPEWERKFSWGKWQFHRIGQIDKWQDMGASGEMEYTYEVIGNIHDTPELLEVSK